MCDCVDSKGAANKISQLLIDNSFSLIPSVLSKNKNTARGYIMLNFWLTSRLLVQCVRLHLSHGRRIIFRVVTPMTLNHRTHKEYRLLLHNFLNNFESDKVRKLCNAAESDERLFWKLLKRHRSTSQMSAFLVGNKLITDKNLIREMQASHFEALGTPSVNENFDSNFLTCVTASIADILKSCTGDHLKPFLYPWSMEKLLVSAVD